MQSREDQQKAKSAKLKTPTLATSAVPENRYSILTGRSMCPNCKRTLAWYDLIPLVELASALSGKCRYCKKPISCPIPAGSSWLPALVFAGSYLFWPQTVHRRRPVVVAGYLAISFGWPAGTGDLRP